MGDISPQLAALHAFVDTMGVTAAVAAVRVDVPLWDTAALVEDATSLLTSFTPAPQNGRLHGGKWQTLSLRSCDGTVGNDRNGMAYYDTPAWTASTYIVPHLLRSLEAADVPASSLQRVRLSVIPPGCNVAWHVDYTDTGAQGPLQSAAPSPAAQPNLPPGHGLAVPLTQYWLAGHGTVALRVADDAPTVSSPGSAATAAPLPIGQYTASSPQACCVGDVDPGTQK